jgi:hypothetical protein
VVGCESTPRNRQASFKRWPRAIDHHRGSNRVAPGSVARETRVPGQSSEEKRDAFREHLSLRRVRSIVGVQLALTTSAMVAATTTSSAVLAVTVLPTAATAPLEQITGDTYVAATSNPDLFVAFVIDDEAQARAYLCDGTGISEWLSGTADDSTVQLSSSTGADVSATLTVSGVIGTATLADGTPVTFEAEPAQGVAGLHTSVVAADRRVQGHSSTGSTLEGIVAAHPLLGDRSEPVYPLVGFLKPAEGEPVAFIVALAGADVPDETRSIVLNDGQQPGRSRTPGRVWVTDPMAVPIIDGTSNT